MKLIIQTDDGEQVGQKMKLSTHNLINLAIWWEEAKAKHAPTPHLNRIHTKNARLLESTQRNIQDQKDVLARTVDLIE